MPAGSRGSYRGSSNPRNQFSRLFMFEYAKENARTFFLLARRAKLSAGWRFSNDFVRLFVFAQPHENGSAQFSVPRPLRKFDFGNKLRVDPMYLFHHRRCDAEHPLAVLL